MSHMVKSIELLGKVPFLADFSSEVLIQLLSNAQYLTYQSNQIIILSQQRITRFYVVVTGWVKLYRETRVGQEFAIAVLGQNDFFGQEALVTDSIVEYTASAVGEVKLLTLPVFYFKETMQALKLYDSFYKQLIKVQIKNIDQLRLRLEHLSYMTAAQRVACFLLRLADGKSKKTELTIQLPFAKALVADLLGMPPETFSRAMKQLSQFGVVTQGLKVMVKDKKKLIQFACEACSVIKEDCP